ncbi:MAG: OmpA family protein, partial [Elusimicrobiales bacterium]|nr:OmpA family protein [Elusimicrobiales bacterium]
TEKYNLSLGQKRANVVKDYYIRLGVNPSKIATISYGEEMPVCFEKTEKCWALNRRAETKITE